MHYPAASFGLLALALVACDTATSPGVDEADSSDAVTIQALDATHVRNSALGIERAEFRDGFCNVFTTNFTLYIGESTSVATKSGNTNYTCKADLAFGPGPEAVINLQDVTFFDFSFEDPPRFLTPCHLRVTPGASGQARVSCHVTPREGMIIPLD